MSNRMNPLKRRKMIPTGIVIGLLLSVCIVPSVSISADATVPTIANWTAVDGSGINTTGEGSPIAASVTLGGTGTHSLYGAGTGASNFKFCATISDPSLNFETYNPDDYVQVDFVSGVTDVKVILAYVGPNDEMFVSASTDGTNFTAVDLSDSASVSATAILQNSLATTLTSADSGYYAPSLTAANWGGSYQIHFATGIKAIRLANDARNRIVGAQTRNCVGLMIPGIIAYAVTPAVNDATMGAATASDANSDGTWDLTATPNAGYKFTGWSCSASQTPASSAVATTTITPTADSTCTATFAAFTATAGTATGGTATATDANSDGTWDLTATPSAGYSFSGWTCTNSQTPASSSSATTTVTLTADTTCTPSFTALALTVTAGTATGGTASATDANSDGTWDLVATPSAGYTFSGWSCTGGQTPASSSSTTTTITPTADTTCTPSFTVVTASAGSAKGSGSINLECGTAKFNFEISNERSRSGVERLKGSLDWQQKDLWKFSGKLDSYSVDGGVGTASGSGMLYFWKKIGRYGYWVAATTGETSVTISFTASTRSVRNSGTFGITFTGTKNPAVSDNLPSISIRSLSSGKIEMSPGRTA